MRLGDAVKHRGAEGDPRRVIVAYRNAIESSRQLSKEILVSGYHNLGAALLRWTDSDEELNESVTLLQQAVDGSNDDDAEKPLYLVDLSTALYTRNQDGDGEAVIRYCRTAVQLVGCDHVNFPEYSGHLGLALVKWDIERSRDEAIRTLKTAVEGLPQHRSIPEWLEGLATALDRYEEGDLNSELRWDTVKWFPVGAFDGDLQDAIVDTIFEMFSPLQLLEDTNCAIMYLRKSLFLKPTLSRYKKLEGFLLKRFSKIGDVQDLEEAAELLGSRVRTVQWTDMDESDVQSALFQYGVVAWRIILREGEVSYMNDFRNLVLEARSATPQSRAVAEICSLGGALCRRKRSMDMGEYYKAI
jgi:tetratricopeptide (TPR) repeat protein